MLDTGSDVSLLKISTAREMGVEVKSSSKIPPLQGISGRRIRVLGQAKVTLASSSNNPISIQVAVVPDHYLQTAALIGMNAIGQASLTLDYKTKKVYWNNITYPLVLEANAFGKVTMVKPEPGQSSTKCQFGRVTTGTHINHYSTSMVEVKIDAEPDTTLIVEAKHR